MAGELSRDDFATKCARTGEGPQSDYILDDMAEIKSGVLAGAIPQTPPELFFPLSNGGPQNWLLGIAARVGTSEDSREPD